jgi:hypothetical protein
MRVLYYSKNLVIGDGKDVSAEERARRTILHSGPKLLALRKSRTPSRKIGGHISKFEAVLDVCGHVAFRVSLTEWQQVGTQSWALILTSLWFRSRMVLTVTLYNSCQRYETS